ncbi:tetratricopeptide repeat protein [Limnofasciculus baicalensis]|uniref:Tetratricopeptide repeat protein n=1 Tax=Limnofasciculus baicalensis BBK-W-15 TaxID=2699891 RepID=A0AAE3GVL1_9CYAN|nr:tetratricopeptide repeat protein [Limnofasciculus baicalensis]MCP2731284.1 tetratricopeptide repeat protein [Limnofasciculus baicalensis BBK-W-15]
MGDSEGEIADYTQALRINHKSIESYLGRGLTRLGLGDNKGAVDDADLVLRLYPNHAPACNLQGMAYRRLGDNEAAIANFKKAAQLYLEQKDRESCRRCLDNITQIQASQNSLVIIPQTEEFYKGAMAKFYRENYREALDDFNWLIQVDPKDAKAYCYRGIVRKKLGNLQGAIQDLGEAMQLNPNDEQIRNHRGLVRIELGDYRGAIDDFTELLRTQPQNAEALANRGYGYCKLGNYRQGIEDYSRALSIKPDNAQFYCQRALARGDFEDYQGAVDDYQKAANIYFDQRDWDSYQRVLNKQKIQAKKAEVARKERANQLNNEDVFIKQENQIWSNVQPNQELQERLLRMVGGYWDVAARLIELAKQKHPGMSENWYLEKVIQDLERDR